MTSHPALTWTLFALFVATGAYSLVRALAPGSWTNRVSHATHVLMSASMAVMPWSWSSDIPSALTIAAFAAASGWYAWLALFRPAAPAGPGDGRHHSGRLLLWYHAGMMLAMVWMAVLSSPIMTGSGPSMANQAPGASGTSAATLQAMPAGGTGGTGGSMVMATPAWSHPLTVAWTAFFVAAAGWFLVRAYRHGRATSRPEADTLASLVMAAGMAASFALMF